MSKIPYSVDIITCMTDSFGMICEKLNIKKGSKIKPLDSHEEGQIYIQHLEVTWKPLLKAIKSIINRDVDEIYTQQILNIIQNWINLTGTLQLMKARDSYLRLLCNSSTPKEHQNELSAKHIQISKALFNIAHCLGSILNYFLKDFD